MKALDILLLFLLIFALPEKLEAQHMQHMQGGNMNSEADTSGMDT